MNGKLSWKTLQDWREDSIGLEVTTHCNRSCSHCFARAGVVQPSSLSIDLVKEITTEGYNAGYRNLHITGGESLLWEGLFEALDYAFDLGYETAFLNTNGNLLNKDYSDRLANYGGLSISVSLDGPEGHHDFVRGRGSYQQTTEGIETALDAGINLYIFTTVFRSLIPDLPYFADMIYRKFTNLKSLTFIQLIRVRRDVIDLSNELLEPDDFLRLVWVASLLNLHGFKTFVLNNPLANVASKLLGMPWIPRSYASDPEGSIFIMTSGAITLSHSSRSSFGSYEPGMIEKVLGSDEYQKATAPDDTICPSCKYYNLCMANGLVRPSEWFRDMHPGVPYCKRVLDRAALSFQGATE
jgi:MoaA/NifB/PqqE/SkfB family radical SAM enzyme